MVPNLRFEGTARTRYIEICGHSLGAKSLSFDPGAACSTALPPLIPDPGCPAGIGPGPPRL